MSAMSPPIWTRDRAGVAMAGCRCATVFAMTLLLLLLLQSCTLDDIGLDQGEMRVTEWAIRPGRRCGSAINATRQSWIAEEAIWIAVCVYCMYVIYTHSLPFDLGPVMGILQRKAAMKRILSCQVICTEHDPCFSRSANTMS